MICSRAPQKPLPQCGGRARAPAVMAGGRRRTARTTVPLASFTGQGPFFSGPGAAGRGPRRIVRRPRDLQKLADVLSGGAAEDPEQFLQLLSAVPGVLGRRRAPLSPSEQDAAWRYARQLQLQQQQQQQQAAAAAAEAQRRAQQQTAEEEQRRDALRAAMLRNARRHLPQYDADALARLASGLAAAGVRDPALCDEILRQMMSQPPRQQVPPRVAEDASSEPRSLAELLDAFVAMRHRPSDAQLAELLRMQQQEQQREAEMERLRQAQVLRSQPRLQPRGMVMPDGKSAAASPPPPPGAAGPSRRTSPEDAARLLYALSRLGYKPDEDTLTELLEQLQPQRLQLQSTPPPQPPAVASPVFQYGRPARTSAGQPQQVQQPQPASRVPGPSAQSEPEEGGKEEADQREEDEQQQQQGVGSARAEHDEGAGELEAQLSYSLQRDAQAVASAVRALERMGQTGKAQQLRERFMRHVQEVQARVAREREARRQQEQEEGRGRRAAAVAAEVGARERKAAAEAEAAAEAAERERQAAAAAAVQRRQLQEEQARALRLQLTRKLRAADQWQQIRALLFTYQEALDMHCLTAAAARLAELLTAARRTTRGLAMTLRERGELGDLLEGLGQLVLRHLEEASAAQAAGVLSSIVRMRHLEEGLLVALLRRLRDTLVDAGGSELAMTLRALAECGVRPSKPWMETFLARAEEALEQFSPEDLATLPVCLAQLGAHPGRSWLGSYLDTLQGREDELSQAAVSEAVRSVAVMDRQFLSAWRQAVTAREQAQAQAWAQTQALAEAKARAAAAAAATAAAQEQEQGQEHQHQKPALAQPRTRADALASVDEMLARSDVRQDDDAVPEELLPPMHPKQRSMSAQQPRAQDPQAQAAGAQAVPAGAVAETMRLADLVPMQSIELDVDSADLLYGKGSPTEGREGPSSSSEQAAAVPSGAAATTPSTLAGGRQLPGSYSMDGFYNPDAYEEDGVEWEGEGEEGEAEPSEGEDLDAIGVPPNQGDAALSTQAAETLAVADQAPVAEQTAVPEQAPPHQGQHSKHDAVSADKGTPRRKPTAEEVAQARALRSVLLERYEALLALRAEREEKERAAAADGDSSARAPSEREVAAAARLLAAREQLQRLEADFENFKRRAKAEREAAVSRAGAETLRPLLAVVDNFERAATQIKPKTDGEGAVHEAYQAVYRELQDFLTRQGLKEVGIVGEAFDPNEHEAVMREDREDVEDGTVTGVFQKGYRLGDVLVRPALVKVAYK